MSYQIITISREFGSGGRTIGREVAERLGIPCYDQEIIEKISVDSSLVIATGGGAVLRERNLFALRLNGRLFFIDRPLHMLVTTDSRPLSSCRADLERRFAERYEIYKRVCQSHIDGSTEPFAVCDKILENF